MDKHEKIALVLVTAVLISTLWYTYARYNDCMEKGGAYVQSQCIKVEVIK